MSVPELRTDRLILRGFTAVDRHPFAAMNADPEVMTYMSRSLDRAASDLFLARIQEHWDADGFGLWAIERRSDGAFLGFAGLSAPSFEAPFTPAVEVGWRLARRRLGSRLRDGGRCRGARLRFRGSRPRRDRVVHGGRQ